MKCSQNTWTSQCLRENLFTLLKYRSEKQVSVKPNETETQCFQEESCVLFLNEPVRVRLNRTGPGPPSCVGVTSVTLTQDVTTNHFICCSTLFNMLQFFSRKTQSEVLCEICGLLLGWRSRLLWLVSRDTACWRPAPPLVLYSAGTLPVWARARGTSSTSQRRPRIRLAAGWTSCSPDPPGGPIRRQQFKVRPIKSWTHSGSIQILLFQ